MDGRRRDEEVHVGDTLSRAPQIGSDASEDFHNRPREEQRFELIEKLTIRRQLRLGVGITESALEDLSVRDDADPYAFVPRFPKRDFSMGVATEQCDQHVGVEEKFTGG